MDYSKDLSAQDSNIPNYPVPANKTNKTLIFIIIILLLIIFGGGGFILAKYLYSPKPAPEITTQPPVLNQPAANSFSNPNTEKVATPSAPVDETTGWKTFAYQDYTFMAPSNWTVTDSNTKSFTDLVNFDLASGPPTELDPHNKAGYVRFVIYHDQYDLTLEDYVIKNHQSWLENRGSAVWNDARINVDNQPAIKSTSDAGIDVPLQIYIKHPTKSQMYSVVYSGDFVRDQKLIERILSTFKFL